MSRRLLAVAALVLAGCTMSAPPPPAAPPPPKPALGDWGIDLAGMDRSVKPGDDFYTYVNGTWDKNAVIPADRSNIGSFQELAILSEKRMREIVDQLEAKPYDQLSGEERKLRDYYDAYMDAGQIETRGLEPVQADLKLIAGLKNKAEVARAMGSPSLGAGSLFSLGIGIDAKDSNAYSVDVGASGLGMPDRSYYLRDDKDIVATRDAYKVFLTRMLTLAGAADADKRAAKILALETEIAKARWERKDRRDRDKMYFPLSYAELKKLAPQFAWDAFFADTQIPLNGGQRQVIVGENTAIPVLARLFAGTPIAVWRDYLTVHYLHSYAQYLPKRFDDADFAFYGTVLGGRTEQNERETRGVRLLDRELGEALGKLYVARYFPPSSKAKAEKLVANLLKAYEQDIRALPWMSETTRQKALEKLSLFKYYIGYPDTWRDYSAYQVKRDDLIGSLQRGAQFEWNRNVVRLGQPVDKTEWYMSPPTVNAYYNPPFNSITFPAAILQPPFFDPDADDAVNYGAIGVVIGHEISHGFDDQGSKYTGQGVLESWWTPEDRSNFESRTKLLVDQYAAFEPLPGYKVNGETTLGENIADLAGLTIALKAYRISLEGKPAPVLDGFTGDQRVFLSLAQVWRIKFKESDLRTRILTDPHTPGPFRVRGMTRNIDDWYTVFGVQPGDKYFLPPEERARLW
jgi:putative endopeptidase